MFVVGSLLLVVVVMVATGGHASLLNVVVPVGVVVVCDYY